MWTSLTHSDVTLRGNCQRSKCVPVCRHTEQFAASLDGQRRADSSAGVLVLSLGCVKALL